MTTRSLFVVVLLNAALFWESVRSKHILVSGGLMRSHHLSMIPAVEELAHRGHRVVFALPNTDEFRGYFSKDIPGVEKVWMGDNGWDTSMELSPDVKNLPWYRIAAQYASMFWNFQDMLEKPVMSMHGDLLRYIEQEKPDLVLAHFFSLALVSQLTDAPGYPPVIPVFSAQPQAQFLVDDWDVRCRYPNIQKPDKINDLKGSLALRIKNRAMCMMISSIQHVVFSQLNAVVRRGGVPPLGSMLQLLRKAPLTVAYGGSPMMLPMPLPETMHLVGIVAKAAPHPIEAPLQRWLDAARAEAAPVLYVSMGTKYEFTNTSGSEAVAALRWAVDALGVRVLWSLRKAQQEQLAHLLPPQGDSLRIEAFTPQPEVLAHAAVKVFLSHCGWGGVTDALQVGVPTLAYPGFAEQFVNAMQLVEAGAGLVVKPDFSNFPETLRRMVAEPSFEQAARATGEELRSHGGLARMIELVEAAADGRFAEQPAEVRRGMDAADPLLTTPQRLEAAICWGALTGAVALVACSLVCCCSLCCRGCTAALRWRSRARQPVAAPGLPASEPVLLARECMGGAWLGKEKAA